MIKLNDTFAAATVNVLAEEELNQVVGGYCHGRKDWGNGHGRRGKRDHDKRGERRDHDSGGYGESNDDSRWESSGRSFDVNNQVIDLDITINQVAV